MIRRIIRESTNERANSSRTVALLLKKIIDKDSEIDRDKEHFWVIGVTAQNAVKFNDLTALGTLTASVVHPREVFRLAISKAVARLIIGHNHPSGDPAPSRDDIAVTQRLKSAGEILGIELIDHVIIGDDGQFASRKELGVF